MNASKTLVHFDGQSDPDLLNGLAPKQLRSLFQVRAGDQSWQRNNIGKMNFLIADQEVLNTTSRGEFWVKLADAHYVDETDERHPDFARTYWGWIEVATMRLLHTWKYLETLGLWQLASEVDRERAVSIVGAEASEN